VSQKRWFHYTTMFHLPRIIGDGLIKPATGKVPHHERPAVWFSFHPVWEQTCNKMVANGEFGDQDSTDRYYGLARIEVPETVASVSWMMFRKTSGATNAELDALEVAALRSGSSPDYWRVSYEPVTSDKWIGIELYASARWSVFGESKWVPLKDSMLREENIVRQFRRRDAKIVVATRDDLIKMGLIAPGDRGV